MKSFGLPLCNRFGFLATGASFAAAAAAALLALAVSFKRTSSSSCCFLRWQLSTSRSSSALLRLTFCRVLSSSAFLAVRISTRSLAASSSRITSSSVRVKLAMCSASFDFISLNSLLFVIQLTETLLDGVHQVRKLGLLLLHRFGHAGCGASHLTKNAIRLKIGDKL
uniref:Uncharacterized protein n=1 Tax=Anopheles melas TaxID=34690 RepID=A0A182TLD9_9DIPT